MSKVWYHECSQRGGGWEWWDGQEIDFKMEADHNFGVQTQDYRAVLAS